MTEAKQSKKREVTQDHKDAMAKGREQGRAVRAYLEALDGQTSKRGRPVDPDRIKKRLNEISNAIDESDALTRVQLTQERIDLLGKLATIENAANAADFEELEKAFIGVAAGYSQRKGISYQAWREIGVPAAVLKQAGVSRGS
jgi:hypothetical protein